jgi:hypothetical protein
MLSWRSIPAIVFFALTASLSGCDEGEPACFRVAGQVIRGNRPLADAVVILHPISADHPVILKPVARTDADGRFRVSTYETNDGAPPGDYVITVEWRAPRVIGEETIRDGKNLLPAQYAKPKSSPVQYTVVEGDNEIPAIRLP